MGIVCKFIHFLYGFMSGMVVAHNTILGMLNVLFFHIYEYTEYFKIKDPVYIDLREYYAGFALASLIPLLSPL